MGKIKELSIVDLPSSKLTISQKKIETYFFRENEKECKLIVTLRYDDECGNGHNTFSMTGTLYEKSNNGRWIDYMGGCIHDEIVKHAPHLKPLVKWHLCSSNGPLHYLADSIYHASDRDCWGKRKGEEARFETQLFFDNVPIPFTKYKEKFLLWLQDQLAKSEPVFDIVRIDHEPDTSYNYNWSPKFTFKGYCTEWYDCPFDSDEEAKNFLLALQNCEAKFIKKCVGWGEGKEPDLEAARASAIWPEATLEDFTEEKLLNRLPGLMQEFKTAMEKIGFIY